MIHAVEAAGDVWFLGKGSLPVNAVHFSIDSLVIAAYANMYFVRKRPQIKRAFSSKLLSAELFSRSLFLEAYFDFDVPVIAAISSSRIAKKNMILLFSFWCS